MVDTVSLDLTWKKLMKTVQSFQECVDCLSISRDILMTMNHEATRSVGRGNNYSVNYTIIEQRALYDYNIYITFMEWNLYENAKTSAGEIFELQN